MKDKVCDCCEGLEKLTPEVINNRPGLDTLTYRVGTYASFLETMKARLTTLCLGGEEDCKAGKGHYPLQKLTTRETSDPAIALLDAWATLAEVLTFYQERIANEGYLRTATEYRSIQELARLVGYKLRPGVAASVYLAFTLEKGARVEIPAGTRGQSIPGPGELPQSFETSKPLQAREEWNEIKPRLTRPQYIKTSTTDPLYLKGITTNLKPNAPLVMIDSAGSTSFRRVLKVNVDVKTNCTEVILVEEKPATQKPTSPTTVGSPLIPTSKVIASSLRYTSPSLQYPASSVFRLLDTFEVSKKFQLPPNALQLKRVIAKSFDPKADSTSRLWIALKPTLRSTYYQVLKNSFVSPGPAKVFALRTTASLFGHNVPKPIKYRENGTTESQQHWDEWKMAESEKKDVFFLDAVYEGIAPGSCVAIQSSEEPKPKIFWDIKVTIEPRTAYGISAKTTKITLLDGDTWRTDNDDFRNIRNTIVYAQSELLELAEEFIKDKVQGDKIELDNLYDGLESGRWVIVSGERADIDGVSGVQDSELAMIAGVTHDVNENLPGDTTHTTLELATNLAYTYKRDTVTIYANVVKATHGETREEVLGSGSGSQIFQSFSLSQTPLTHLAAATPTGTETTLAVRVNDVRWHEADNLFTLGATDRSYITQTNEANKTSIVFGNGQHGARLPSGVENVKATYRFGTGKPGNVAAKQISLLATKPLGVKAVINPLPASGGADREQRDQARRNAPLAIMTLDRLVSVADYANLARTFAGIGKASAARLTDGQRQLMHLTIAGADDIPIETYSDLYLNLCQTLCKYGDPYQPIQVSIRKLKLLVISAQVRVLPDYQWELVELKIRKQLLDMFSFEHRELGQDALSSEAISAIQSVEGVVLVNLTTFDAVAEDITSAELEQLATTLKLNSRIKVNLDQNSQQQIQPAEIAYLSPEVKDTLILTELTL
ncbi:MAG: putative baseplate assembly protein [Thioploca sp.]|nr:putative baseplate assembly protein [Thioploca sp.]